MGTKVLEKLITYKRYQVAELYVTGKSDEAYKASVELDELIMLAIKRNIVESEIDLDKFLALEATLDA